MKRRIAVFLALCWALLVPSSNDTYADKLPVTIHTMVINKADNTLKTFASDGQLIGKYPVATGMYHCTPEGTFRIIQKSVVSRSGKHRLGTHWMGLNTLGRRHRARIGIHGTNKPDSIGKWSSLGCIRMRNEHIREVYEAAPLGTKVMIVDVAVLEGSANADSGLRVESVRGVFVKAPVVVSPDDQETKMRRGNGDDGLAATDARFHDHPRTLSTALKCVLAAVTPLVKLVTECLTSSSRGSDDEDRLTYEEPDH